MSSAKLATIVLLIINLLWQSCWCYNPQICVIGQGSGFCQMSSTNCIWTYQQLGHVKRIGSHLSLNEDSEVGEYLCRNTISDEIDDSVFVMPAGNQFTCAHCVGMTTCHNGIQAEFHLTVNINHHSQIIDRRRCSLYKNGYKFICDIGTRHCLVDAVDSSGQYVVKCPIRGFDVDMVSATKNVNSTLPGCTTFSQTAAGPSSTCQGNDAILKCKILIANHTATPANWSRDGQPVGYTSKHTAIFNTTDGITYLVVHNVSVEDDNRSQYTCSDDEGTISSSVMLNVLGLPHSSDIIITSQCLTHLTISWTSDFDELTTCGPVTYNVTVSHYDRVIQSVTVNNASSTLSGLVPATNYTITIYTTYNTGYSVTSTTATTAGRLTNLRGTANSLTSVTISWDHVVATSFNCAEEEHLKYMVSLLYPNGTDLQISTTLNHINFKNLTKGTTYVVTVTAATPITGAASSSQITVTTGTKLEKGNGNPTIPISAALGVICAIIICAVLIFAVCWYRAHCRNRKYTIMHLCREWGTIGEAVSNPQSTEHNETVNNDQFTECYVYRNGHRCTGQELMEIIKQAHVKIDQHINFQTLLKCFNKYGIFTRTEMNHFLEDYHEHSVNNLIQWLEAKSDEGILNFVKALNDEKEHSGHKQILQKLEVEVHR